MIDKKAELAALRHSAAHLLAQAILQLYPKTLLTIGPATAEGFFYDVLPQENFKEEDLPKIEARMHELAAKNYPITHKKISKQEARTLFANNPFKLELIKSIEGDTVGLSEQGDFIDLCKGGHVASTGLIKFFKLTGLSGSYWKADKTNQALQRISGTAFLTQQDMEHFLHQKELAAQYDHRKLGKELDLYSFHEEGPGFAFLHPKGKSIMLALTNFMRGLLHKLDYKEIQTPIVLSDQLWRRSGHYDHYKDNMYFCTIDKKSYAIRPMNCPGAILVYQERPRSYRELPLRLSEFGLVHRHELSGVLHGLFRVRAFTQDDGHIFCTPEQIEQEVMNTIKLVFQVYKKFNFNDIQVTVSTKPKKAMGDDALWHQATQALENALNKAGVSYSIAPGEGAFYGPKIEFRIRDSIGREWQCGTIQIDFFQPINFELSYIAPSGQKERPVIIHRAIYGSLERFLGIITEHFKGHFPFWVAPVQIKILTITDEQKDYAAMLFSLLQDKGIRVEIDQSSDPISGKIKTAQLEKVPWMLIIGKKEAINNTISIRYADGKQEMGLPIDQLMKKIEEASK